VIGLFLEMSKRNRSRNLTPVLPKIRTGSCSRKDISPVRDADGLGLSEEGRQILGVLTDSLDSLLQRLEAKDIIQELQKENASLKRSVHHLETRVDEIENYDRLNNSIVSGEAVPTATPNEVTSQVVIDLFDRAMRYKLNSENVLAAFRLGARPVSQAADRRSILVKLRNSEVRQDVVQACRSAKPTKLFVSDNLTPVRASILYALRQVMKRCPEIEYCGSRDGKVFVWKKSKTDTGRKQKVFINTVEQLQKLCGDEFDVDPLEFIHQR